MLTIPCDARIEVCDVIVLHIMDPAVDRHDPAARDTFVRLEIAERVGAIARAHGPTVALENLRTDLDAAAVLLRSPHTEFETLAAVSEHAALARHRNVLGTLPMTSIRGSAASSPLDVLAGDAALRARWKRWGIHSLIVTESTPGVAPIARLEVYATQPWAVDAEAGFALRTLAREFSAAVAIQSLQHRHRVAESFIGSLERAGPLLVHAYVPSRGATLFANGPCREFFSIEDFEPLDDRAIEHNRHPWLRYVDPRDRRRLQRQLQSTELLAAGNVLDGTYRFERSGATHHLHLWSTRVAQGNPGRAAGDDEFMVTALDITRERALERHLENLAARERRSVGRELHDGLCQDLIGLKIALDRQRRRASEDPQTLVHTMASVSASLSECLRQARAIAQGLHPIQISGDDLPAALRDLVQTTQDRFAVPTSLDVRGSFEALGADEAVQLYWIAREAVLNAARHARATTIEVDVECKAPRLRLFVIDDGCGFDPHDPPGSGMGTRILERRARLIDADLRIESTPGAGTRVICEYEIHGRNHED